MALRRYWLEFDLSLGTPYLELLQGCGVTAYDYDDALHLIQERLLKAAALPPIRKVTENVDASTLDQNHVIPNMGIATVRGIWFPLGFN